MNKMRRKIYCTKNVKKSGVFPKRLKEKKFFRDLKQQTSSKDRQKLLYLKRGGKLIAKGAYGEVYTVVGKAIKPQKDWKDYFFRGEGNSVLRSNSIFDGIPASALADNYEQRVIKKVDLQKNIVYMQRMLLELLVNKFCIENHFPFNIFIDFLKPKNFESFKSIYYVLQKQEMSLFHLFAIHNKNNKQINRRTIKLLMYKLFKQVYVLHKHGIIHNDIKPANILVHNCSSYFGLDSSSGKHASMGTLLKKAEHQQTHTINNSKQIDLEDQHHRHVMSRRPNQHHHHSSSIHQFQASSLVPHSSFDDNKSEISPTIIDFGLACSKIHPHNSLKNKITTLWYRAPSLLFPKMKGYSTTRCDIWALGLVFLECFTTIPTFAEENEEDQMKVIKEWLRIDKLSQFEVIYDIPPDAIDLIRKMTNFEPSKRYSIQKALGHKYFKELIDCDPDFYLEKYEQDTVDKKDIPKFTFNPDDYVSYQAIKKKMFAEICNLRDLKPSSR